MPVNELCAHKTNVGEKREYSKMLKLCLSLETIGVGKGEAAGA